MTNKTFSLLAVMALSGFASAQTFFDDFNRADSSNLGANWTTIESGTSILSNFATGTINNSTRQVVTGYNSTVVGTAVSMFISAGTTTSFAAAIIGYSGSNTNESAFIKVQSNSGGVFDSVGFYNGNNSNGALAAGFGALGSSFSSARITIWASDADTINLGIDTNFDTVYDQMYSSSGLSGLSLGTGFGLGTYGDVMVDNYNVAGPVPEPASIAVLGLGSLLILRRRKVA